MPVPVWPKEVPVPTLEFVVPLCWLPASGAVGAATGAAMVPGTVFVPAEPV